jgi:hypothetical protein
MVFFEEGGGRNRGTSGKKQKLIQVGSMGGFTEETGRAAEDPFLNDAPAAWIPMNKGAPPKSFSEGRIR